MGGSIEKKPKGNRNPKSLANLTGRGRPKGVPNKATTQVKEMVIQALSEAGGVDYLVKQAAASPAAFLTLVGKVIPLQVAGDSENPVQHIVRVELTGATR